MRGGRLYPLPPPGHPTGANGSSSSPGLLPTPAAGNFNDGEDLESWEARRQANLAKGINGNGQGTPLAIAVQLLKTPTAQLAVNGGSQHPDKRREGGHGPRLRDVAPALLPTPRAQEFEIADTEALLERREQVRQAHGNGNGFGLTLSQEIALLKTPTAQLAVNGGSQHPDKRRGGGHGPTLADQVEHTLLPTPNTGQSPNGHGIRGGKRGNGHQSGADLDSVVTSLLPTPTARLGDDTGRGADPARYKGPQSLNGRRSNLDDCIAAVETRAPWLGEPMSPLSAAGSESSDDQLLLPLSPGEPASA